MKGPLTGKDPDAGKEEGEEGITEDEMVGWHHRLNEQEFEQIPGDSEGQENPACCSPRGHSVGHNLVTDQEKQQSRRLE